jgi:hypothetical protein
MLGSAILHLLFRELQVQNIVGAIPNHEYHLSNYDSNKNTSSALSNHSKEASQYIDIFL